MSLLWAVILWVPTGAHAEPWVPAAISFITSLYDTSLRMLQGLHYPIVTSESIQCDKLKSLLGITYEQMQEKNNSNQDVLTIDVVTKTGQVKYNISSSRRIARVLSNANTVIILVHGFLESSDGWMVQALASEYLKQSGLKILALDGRKAINYDYFKASTQVRFIGKKLGRLLSDIVQSGQDPSSIVLIGHSLGAHIAGIASKQLRALTGRQVGRITALDPAGLCFSNVSAAARLGRSDALYVDVVHTNAGELGLVEPVGHKDFYPNGGLKQPGCYIPAACAHTRAWELLAEAINAPDHFPARKCENYTLFSAGACAQNEVAFMGNASGSPGLYFFSTASSSPFGLGISGSGIK